MTSPTSSQSPVTPFVMRIRGCGNIRPFKGQKRIVQRREKAPMLITDPAVKKAMDRVSRAIESLLRSASQTAIAATPTGAPPRSLTHLCPPDDAWAFIPDLRITSELVPVGDEGADITIEFIPDPEPAKLDGVNPPGPH